MFCAPDAVSIEITSGQPPAPSRGPAMRSRERLVKAVVRMRETALTLLIVLSLGAPHVEAAVFNLSRVADLNTPVPDGTGNFTSFSSPVISGANIAFFGFGTGQQGIYLFDGATLTRVVDLNTQVPGGTGNFTSFGSFAISGGNITFFGLGTGQQGIYLFDGATLSRVADLNTPIPGGTGNFTSFRSIPVISGRSVAFLAEFTFFSSLGGVYLFDGAALSRVADLNTPVPGGIGSFGQSFASAVISGSSVAFTALSPGFFSKAGGVYLSDGATLRRVADLNTPVPGGTGSFTSFESTLLGISGDNIAFFGSGTGQVGIYLFDGVTLSRVADLNTPVPGGTGNFTSLGVFAISGRSIAFLAQRSPLPFGSAGGVYLFDGAILRRVADLNTPIPDGTGSFGQSFASVVISGNDVAFTALSPNALAPAGGVYFFDGVTLSRVADRNTPVPDGTGNFTSFDRAPGISGGNVAFAGSGTGQAGVYLATESIPESIPTLNEWGMTVMAIVLVGAGTWRMIRNRRGPSIA